MAWQLSQQDLTDILWMVIDGKRSHWPSCKFVVALKDGGVVQVAYDEQRNTFAETMHYPKEFTKAKELVDILTQRTEELVTELRNKQEVTSLS